MPSPVRPLTALALMAMSAACGGDPASNTGASASVSAGTSTSTSTGSGGGGTGGSMPAPPGIVFLTDIYGFPPDITPDGRTVLLQTLDTGDVYFYDTVTQALDYKTSIGEPQLNSASGISATLRVTASEGNPSFAGVWSESTGWLDLADPYPQGCDSFRADGWDLTADGKVAVGMVWNGCHTEAFRWTDTGGQGTLKTLPILGTGFEGKPSSNRATKVSDDGSIIGGFAQNDPLDRVPAAWRADGTGFLLDPANTAQGEVLAISADGKILAGYLGTEAITWTESGGIVTLDRPPGVDPSYRGLVNAVAANGDLVFGRYGDPWNSPLAFVWTPDANSRAIQDVIAKAGITIPPEYAIWNVTGASADGTVVVGTAFGANTPFVPWVLRMPVSSYAP